MVWLHAANKGILMNKNCTRKTRS